MKNRKKNLRARDIRINGIVQGVGFRPFVYRLAGELNLKGDVANTSRGVFIHLEGDIDQLEAFFHQIRGKCPPLAKITEIRSLEAEVAGCSDFTIVKSSSDEEKFTLISPDVTVCEDCLEEMNDPSDRRFGYPFINCTNCGPRYTIIRDVPYDRPKTSMSRFVMCEQCQAEYDDPGNRRFHAQPNACSVCGPRVTLCDGDGNPLDVPDPIASSVDLLEKGHILAIKGLGGFHLAVDATNADSVATLRARKRREEKPFALMARDIEHISTFAHVEKMELELLESVQRPIVLLSKKNPNPIAEAVSPGNRYFGVMLPYTPLHHLIFNQDLTALVMTSGNMSTEPIVIDNDEAFERLSGIADFFLVHDRDILLRSDDSILKVTWGLDRVIRRSRGFVPVPVFLREEVPSILACGGELKNTVCLTRGNQAFVSQHIGDMDNYPTLEFYRHTIDHLKRILAIEPEFIAHDLHPDYQTTLYAEEFEGIEKIGVQHHHAHIVSCMAENRISGNVIGLSFDGTGYGTDGQIWGGEILTADKAGFYRSGHIDYVPMPGGASAIREPWRMGLSYLYKVFGDDFRNLEIPFLKSIDSHQMSVVIKMIQKQVNAPLTSSLGRLFDGVAAICGIRNQVHYEGQAAMELEMTASDTTSEYYGYDWSRTPGEPIRIIIDPIIRGIVGDLMKKIPVSVISRKFHNTVLWVFSRICCEVKGETGLDRVVLSGGVFQNSILLEGMHIALMAHGFRVFSHHLVPSNDGGLSLGQAVAAAAIIKKR